MSTTTDTNGGGGDTKRQFCLLDLSDESMVVPDVSYHVQKDNTNGHAVIPTMSLNFTVSDARVHRGISLSYNQRTYTDEFKKQMEHRRNLRRVMFEEMDANDSKRKNLYNRPIKNEDRLPQETQGLDQSHRNKCLKNVYCKFFPYSDDRTVIRNTHRLCCELGKKLFAACQEANLTDQQRKRWEWFPACMDFMFEFEFGELTEPGTGVTYHNIRLRDFMNKARPTMAHFPDCDKDTASERQEVANDAFDEFRKQLYTEMFLSKDDDTADKWLQKVTRVHFGTDVVWNHDFHEEVTQQESESGDTTISERMCGPNGETQDTSVIPTKFDSETGNPLAFRKLAPYDLYPESRINFKGHFFRIFMGKTLSTRVIVNNIVVKEWGPKPERNGGGGQAQPIDDPSQMPAWMQDRYRKVTGAKRAHTSTADPTPAKKAAVQAAQQAFAADDAYAHASFPDGDTAPAAVPAPAPDNQDANYDYDHDHDAAATTNGGEEAVVEATTS